MRTLLAQRRTQRLRPSSAVTEVVNTLNDLELPDIEIRTCGCLGECGNGPNVALLPIGIIRSGVATPAQAFKLLRESAGVQIDDRDIKAIQLRQEGNQLAMSGNARSALAKYEEAIACDPPHGLHKLHSNASLAALTCGDVSAATEAALRAIDCAPKDYTTAKIRAIEAYKAGGDVAQARSWLVQAIRDDPSFKNTPIYKDLSAALF